MVSGKWMVRKRAKKVKRNERERKRDFIPKKREYMISPADDV